MTPQNGIAVWIVLAILLGLTGLSAVGGYLLLQAYDDEATRNGQTQDSQTSAGGKHRSQADSAAPTNLASRKDRQADLSTGSGSAPVTDVDLTLKGIVARSDPGRSRALIAKGNEPEQAYRAGDDILKHVSLDRVEEDHVVLLVDGRSETLYLNRTLSGSGRGFRPSAGNTARALPGSEKSLLRKILDRQKAIAPPTGQTDITRNSTGTEPATGAGSASSAQDDLDDDIDWEDDDWEDDDWEDEDVDEDEDEDWDDEDWDDDWEDEDDLDEEE